MAEIYQNTTDKSLQDVVKELNDKGFKEKHIDKFLSEADSWVNKSIEGLKINKMSTVNDYLMKIHDEFNVTNEGISIMMSNIDKIIFAHYVLISIPGNLHPDEMYCKSGITESITLSYLEGAYNLLLNLKSEYAAKGIITLFIPEIPLLTDKQAANYPAHVNPEMMTPNMWAKETLNNIYDIQDGRYGKRLRKKL